MSHFVSLLRCGTLLVLALSLAACTKGSVSSGGKPDAASGSRDATIGGGNVDGAASSSVDAGIADLGVAEVNVDTAAVPSTDGRTTGGSVEAGSETRGLDGPPTTARQSFVVMTFNTGTNTSLSHDQGPNDGYTSKQAQIAHEWYGNGLSWPPAIEAARNFFKKVNPDVIVFQELFWTGECPMIPQEAHRGFVCETWTPGSPTVVQTLLDENWQIMCHWGKTDKCAAVNRRIGRFRECASNFCLDGMKGSTVQGCGKGARIGRGVIDLIGGGTITLVNVHASSGTSLEDLECRRQQVDQVFVDLGLGDKQPAANGERNLIMGDLNTDPARTSFLDASARRWNEFVGSGKRFHFISEVGSNATPTYSGFLNIDHVISDRFGGTCWVAGVTPGQPPVMEAVYFDHKPIVCTIKPDKP